ncbi:hypothetical protein YASMINEVIRUS_543 [Yasminevirus sp. GU-2018]|uniref:Minor capsid protein P8 central region domain-containing protein n=1 Tax=Yasminevirus sp. GU-2018 TaxID=2420051 RepID=A0A5K0U8E2_9VIRU|nr:hypothetical protein YASMINEVIRUS_543 [Yasminevirus sp. GU-2018]
MADYDNYAPVNRTLSYGGPDIYSREDMEDAPGDPYAVEEDYYTKLALRQWKVCPSKVAKEYFSVTNIRRIQKQIKREVYNRSYKKFKLSEDQNVLDLLQSMIVVYEQYGKDLPSRVVSQVKMLNEQTVQYIVPDMMTNLKQHYGYLDDIKNPINPLPQPINVNHAGRTQLPSIAQLYGL